MVREAESSRERAREAERSREEVRDAEGRAAHRCIPLAHAAVRLGISSADGRSTNASRAISRPTASSAAPNSSRIDAISLRRAFSSPSRETPAPTPHLQRA